jgi:hypothetical protein
MKRRILTAMEHVAVWHDDDTANQAPDFHLPTEVVGHYAQGGAQPDNDLIEDIRKNGIQRPIEIATNGNQGFLVDGNNRHEAARRLGIPHVPVRIHQASPGQVEEYDPPLEQHVQKWLAHNHPHSPDEY